MSTPVAWSATTTLTDASTFPKTLPLPSLASQTGLAFRKLTWSLGLKRAAGLVEKTDEAIVAGAPEPADELVCVIATQTFILLRRVPGAVASMLELAELYGRGAVERFVAGVMRDMTQYTRQQLRRRGLYDASPLAPVTP